MTIRVRDLPRARQALLDYESQRINPTNLDAAYRRHLQAASLWWVSPDMCQLAIGSADDLPDWSPSIARPDMCGLLVWAGDTLVVDASDTVGEYPLRAVMWESASDRIRCTLYTDRRWLSDPYGVAAHAHEMPLVEFGAFDLDAELDYSALTERMPPEIVRVLRLIGTTWLLMQQPTVADERRISTSKRQDPAPEGTPPKITDVQIIDLRRLVGGARESSEGGGATRTYHHRWLVRGHWRQQRVGPGRKYVKPVYVAPHIKGPEDAPLKEHRVNVWRR